MSFVLGAIVGGKVTGITKFGAFVALEGNSGTTGLVHISEVAHSYVNDIAEHLTVGQEVMVKIVSIGDGGKIGLSIKKATEPPQSERPRPQFRDNRPPRQTKPVEPETFEDRLSKFMQDSNKNLSGSKMFTEKRSRRRGGRD